MGDGAASLQHQRLRGQEATTSISDWYHRGARVVSEKPVRFRKGACENCGAMTHDKKSCTERPRRSLAKWSGQNLASDEVIEKVDLSWDGKRDRWNGYDANMHKQVGGGCCVLSTYLLGFRPLRCAGRRAT